MENTSAEKNIKHDEHKRRLESLRSMQIGGKGSQMEIANPRVIVAQAVRREFPDLPYDEVQKATRELVLAPRRASVKVGNKDIPVADLQYQIAESIELINSETNSAQEYFSWFQESAEIMQHMNDGYISDADLKERNDWISASYTREAEIQTCLALYASSSFPEARKKYEILYNKLAKLRQIRTAIKECTGRRSDETAERIDKAQKIIDYEKAKIYVAAMREFSKNDPDWNMPKNTLRKLRIYRGDNEDLAGEYDWFYGMYEPDYDPDMEYEYQPYPYMDDLREYVLFHWNEVDSYAPVNSYAENIYEDRRSASGAAMTVKDIRDKIASLSGRRTSRSSRTDKGRISSFNARKFSNLFSKKDRDSSSL